MAVTRRSRPPVESHAVLRSSPLALSLSLSLPPSRGRAGARGLPVARDHAVAFFVLSRELYMYMRVILSDVIVR